jgi:hypothetical protein
VVSGRVGTILQCSASLLFIIRSESSRRQSSVCWHTNSQLKSLPSMLPVCWKTIDGAGY